MRQFGFDQDVLDINATGCPLSDAMKPLVHDTAIEYWANKVKRVLVPSRHHEGYATTNMKLYWRKVMSTFVDYVSNWEVEQVVISPFSRELSANAQLIPNTRSTSAWATRQNLGFAEWRADLNGWVVHGGDVPMEWSEKNTIVRAPKSNPATGATKRSHGKSPSSEDKPKKIRRKRGVAKKPKIGSPKPSTVVQSGSGAAPAINSSVPAATSTSTPSSLKHYRRKTNAGKVQFPKSSKEVSLQSLYLLTSFFFSFILGANHMFLWLQQSSDSKGT